MEAAAQISNEKGVENEYLSLKPMEELVKIVEEGLKSEKKRILAEIEAGYESTKRNMITKIESYLKHGNQASTGTNMKLEFRNRIAKTILTCEEIKGDDGEPMEVALIDDSSDMVVDAGPEASADVKIVLLKGKPEGDDEEFNANIVPEVEGKQPILAGNVTLQLRRGVGVVDNIKFRHHAAKIKPPRFKLGAIVVDDSRIKEAKTKPFTLKDFRAKYYKKHENPSLSDEVSRLVFIRRGGQIYKRLEDNNILTVEHFLIQLLINPEGLKNIVRSQAKRWEATVNNARACLIGERVYLYMDHAQKTGIIFNIVGHVLGLYPESYYSRTSKQNWEEVKPFSDQNSLHQHLYCSDTYMGPSPSCRGGGHENTGASEMVGESSNRYSNVSDLSGTATMNFTGETDGQDFAFGCDFGDDEIRRLYDAMVQHGGIGMIYGCSNGVTTEGSGGEAVVGRRSNAPKRWKILVCILRWLIRKKECRCYSLPQQGENLEKEGFSIFKKNI